MIAAPVFRFDEARHEYFLGEARIPSATSLIQRGGLYGESAQFFTEASRDRGRDVHLLCAGWDLGMDYGDWLKEDQPNRGYLLAWMAATDALKPSWDAIEEASVSLKYKYGVRADRVGMVFARRSVNEIKSGAKLPAKPVSYVDEDTGEIVTLRGHHVTPHAVQTALQVIAESERWPLPWDQWQRLTTYVKPNGKFTVDRHEDRRDFDVAQTLISRFC